MSNLMEYKGYHGSVEFSAEDECFFGKIEFINDLIMFEGADVASIKEAFHSAVDDYLAHCERTGAEPNQPYKGTFNVRVGPELHRKAVVEARKRGQSLNDFVHESISCMIDGGTVVHNHHTVHIASPDVTEPTFMSHIEYELPRPSNDLTHAGVMWKQ